MFSYEVHALNRLKQSLFELGRFGPAILDPETKKWADQTSKTLRQTPYPSRRPGQRYVRKGRLTASWRYERRGMGHYAIFNRANRGGRFYAGYVVGRGKQAWMHKGRWWVTEDIIEKRIPKLVEGLRRRVEEVFNG